MTIQILPQIMIMPNNYALTSRLSSAQRKLCESIGVDMEGKGTAVVDHVDHVLGTHGHTTVLADGFSNSDAILGGIGSRVSHRPCHGATDSVHDVNLLSQHRTLL